MRLFRQAPRVDWRRTFTNFQIEAEVPDGNFSIHNKEVEKLMRLSSAVLSMPFGISKSEFVYFKTCNFAEYVTLGQASSQIVLNRFRKSGSRKV